MSPVQEPVCTADYPRTRIDAALIRAEFLHPDSFDPGTFLEEGDAAMRKRAENVSQHKLPTYQAAAVVVRMAYSDPTYDADTIFLLSSQSTVLAGVESQLLVFFKSSPNSTQQPVPVILQYLLILTYIALIFSVGATINSLILTRAFGNVPMLVGRLQEKISSVALPTIESPPIRKRSSDNIIPWRWRLLEGHCTYDKLWAPVAESLTFHGYWQGYSRWSYPCCVSQLRSSYIYGRKKNSLSESPSQWRACLRCFLYCISYPFLGEAWEPKGRTTWRLSLAITVGTVLITTCCLPLRRFPQQLIPCVLHAKRVIEILYLILTSYESDHWHGRRLTHVEHRYY